MGRGRGNGGPRAAFSGPGRALRPGVVLPPRAGPRGPQGGGGGGGDVAPGGCLRWTAGLAGARRDGSGPSPPLPPRRPARSGRARTPLSARPARALAWRAAAPVLRPFLSVWRKGRRRPEQILGGPSTPVRGLRPVPPLGAFSLEERPARAGALGGAGPAAPGRALGPWRLYSVAPKAVRPRAGGGTACPDRAPPGERRGLPSPRAARFGRGAHRKRRWLRAAPRLLCKALCRGLGLGTRGRPCPRRGGPRPTLTESLEAGVCGNAGPFGFGRGDAPRPGWRARRHTPPQVGFAPSKFCQPWERLFPVHRFRR